MRTLSPGTLLEGRYEILKVLGMGGMSTVYLARDRRFTGVDKLCAIKEMAELVGDQVVREESLGLFEREANILAGLSHPAIPKIYDFFSEGDKAYLVLEYVEGKDLERLVESSPDCLAEDDVVDWALQICDVLTYLHTRQPDTVIFRDLKPSNIMLTEPGRVVLIDFGIAKVFRTDRKGTMVGTEGYAPPEQYKGVAEPRTDIYALGATMHHLLTKSDPRFETPFTFQQRPPRQLNPKVSEALDAVIGRAVSYDIEKRFDSAAKMKEALLATRSMASRAVAPNAVAPSSVPVSVGGEPRLLWEFAFRDEIRSTPLIQGGSVYIGSYDNTFCALDAKTGDLKWSFSTQGGICSSACVCRDSVVFGSEDGNVYAVHFLTGRQLWSFPTGGPVRSSPRASSDIIFVGSDDQNLYAIDGRLGRSMWRFPTWGPIRSSPGVGDGAVYVGSDDEYVYAVDAFNGISRWKYHTTGPVISSPAVTDQFVVAASTDRSIFALDIFSGFPVWRITAERKITSSPAVAEDRVLVGSADRSLYCIDLKTGRINWSFATGGPITSSPKIYADSVYVGSSDGHIYCLDTASGKLRWKFNTKRPIPGSPAFEQGVVYFGSLDGKVYALTA